VLQVEMPRSDGGRHVVTVAGVAGAGPLDLAGVVDDAAVMGGFDLELASLQAIGRDDVVDTVAATADRPWDQTARLARSRRC